MTREGARDGRCGGGTINYYTFVIQNRLWRKARVRQGNQTRVCVCGDRPSVFVFCILFLLDLHMLLMLQLSSPFAYSSQSSTYELVQGLAQRPRKQKKNNKERELRYGVERGKGGGERSFQNAYPTSNVPLFLSCIKEHSAYKDTFESPVFFCCFLFALSLTPLTCLCCFACSVILFRQGRGKTTTSTNDRQPIFVEKQKQQQ